MPDNLAYHGGRKPMTEQRTSIKEKGPVTRLRPYMLALNGAPETPGHGTQV